MEEVDLIANGINSLVYIGIFQARSKLEWKFFGSDRLEVKIKKLGLGSALKKGSARAQKNRLDPALVAAVKQPKNGNAAFREMTWHFVIFNKEMRGNEFWNAWNIGFCGV